MSIKECGLNFDIAGSADLFDQLDAPTKNIIKEIDSIVGLLVDSSSIIDRKIRGKIDNESRWYSYVLSVDITPSETLLLNKKFIDICIDNELYNLLDCNVIFRFETGEDYASKDNKVTRHCSGSL
ncbi:Uncharacterised protein [Legionella donaldsonii]|uniref:Uncharacterized protein n=1 Tax=Legionella donaldsonii TaxID=45060 RepID=A0A378J8Y2_9GAMM|nr:hypothetical protein [Legionella donaldsonii]STX44294.1 Uncharacterised protein [Legionella donaldsonii]